MIDNKNQQKINRILRKIEYLQSRNYYLLHTVGLPIEQFNFRVHEREINKEKIRALRAKLARLYITYSK